MEALVLVKDIDKYGGKYVATKDFTDKNVVSCGDNPVSVFNDAVRSGIEDPVIFYVPKKGVVHIYLICR
jgi:hypothetical protein